MSGPGTRARVGLVVIAPLALVGCGEGSSEPLGYVPPAPPLSASCAPVVPGVAPAVVTNPPAPTPPAGIPSALALVTDDADQGWPVIFGDLVAWSDRRHGDAEIYVMDLTTGEETRITHMEGQDQFPDLWERRLVYQSDRNGGTDIFLYDLDTGVETQVTTDPADDRAPRIHADRILYESWRSGYPSVHRYDIVRGGDRSLSQGYSRQPDVSGDWGVWVATVGGVSELFAYDFTRDCLWQMTTGAGAQRPRIDGTRVVYENHSRDNAAPVDAIDLETREIRRLSPYPTIGLDISGDLVVLADRRNDDPETQIREREIIAYDLTSGEEIPLTWDGYPQITPAISGTRVVWMGNESQDLSEDLDLYTTEIDR